jgi:hypothetical protein
MLNFIEHPAFEREKGAAMARFHFGKDFEQLKKLLLMQFSPTEPHCSGDRPGKDTPKEGFRGIPDVEGRDVGERVEKKPGAEDMVRSEGYHAGVRLP